jgi:apolipoprotein N-acyltransferase
MVVVDQAAVNGNLNDTVGLQRAGVLVGAISVLAFAPPDARWLFTLTAYLSLCLKTGQSPGDPPGDCSSFASCFTFSGCLL